MRPPKRPRSSVSRPSSQVSRPRTVDVACGTGYLTRYLRGEVVALDQSATMLEVARGVLPGIELVRADVPPLPFDDDAFDRVFTSHFYGHIASTEERELLITEAMRVARELVVVEQAWRPGLPHQTREQRELRDGSRHRIFKRYYTTEELRRELGGAVALETRAFIAVRTVREPSAPDEVPERSPSEPR